MTALVNIQQGGLGNRLLLSVPLMAFAKDQGISVHNLALDQYASCFQGTSSDILARFPSRRSKVPPTLRRRHLTFLAAKSAAGALARTMPHPGMPTVIRLDWDQHAPIDRYTGVLARHPLVLLQGFMFTYSNIRTHRDELKEHFSLVPDIARRVATRVASARAGADVVVGLHVRRGDYKGHLGGRYYFEWSQYRDLLSRILEVFGPKTRIVVVSDDREASWRLKDRNVRVLNGTAVEDMYSLAECDYVVGPPSTFSMWASFIGDTPLYQCRTIPNELSIKEFDVSWAVGRDRPMGVPESCRELLYERSLSR